MARRNQVLARLTVRKAYELFRTQPDGRIEADTRQSRVDFTAMVCHTIALDFDDELGPNSNVIADISRAFARRVGRPEPAAERPRPLATGGTITNGAVTIVNDTFVRDDRRPWAAGSVDIAGFTSEAFDNIDRFLRASIPAAPGEHG